MPKIPDDVVKAVIDAAKIEDVVGDFVTLRKAGVNLTGLCPFHDDKNDGNFIVRPSTIPASRGGNTYHCFVCMRKGEGGGPVDFLMKHERLSFPDAIRWLGKKYCIEVDDVPLNWTPPPPRPTPPPPPLLEIPRSYVKRTMEMGGDKNIFIYWMMHLPWDDEQRNRLQSTIWQYCVGGWRDGRVVFWQIDHRGIPRAAKLMKFYPMNHPKYGHRVKEEHPGWIYNQDGCWQQLEPDKHTILKPLFGCHLLHRYPDASINIVESEKTALVMANYYGNLDQQLWLACGGLKFLQLDSLQPLIDQGRTIWLWPDKDGRDDWQEMADKLGYDKCRLYTQFFDTCWTEADGDKADIADIAIRMMRTGERPRHTGDGQGATEQNAAAGFSHGVTLAPTSDPNPDTSLQWYGDQPFLDEEELADPRIHQWRMAMRNAHSSKWYQRHYPDTMTADKAVKEYPILEPLLNDQTD